MVWLKPTDFGLRFPDSLAPTIAEVTTFCADSVLAVDSDLPSVLEDNGLQIVRLVDA